MRRHHYSGMDAHAAEHRKLMADVLALQEKFAWGRVDITVETAQALHRWIEDHVQGSDQSLARHIRSQEDSLTHA